MESIVCAIVALGIGSLVSLPVLGIGYLVEKAYNRYPAFRSFMDQIS